MSAELEAFIETLADVTEQECNVNDEKLFFSGEKVKNHVAKVAKVATLNLGYVTVKC